MERKCVPKSILMWDFIILHLHLYTFIPNHSAVARNRVYTSGNGVIENSCNRLLNVCIAIRKRNTKKFAVHLSRTPPHIKPLNIIFFSQLTPNSWTKGSSGVAPQRTWIFGWIDELTAEQQFSLSPHRQSLGSHSAIGYWVQWAYFFHQTTVKILYSFLIIF